MHLWLRDFVVEGYEKASGNHIVAKGWAFEVADDFSLVNFIFETVLLFLLSEWETSYKDYYHVDDHQWNIVQQKLFIL